MTERAEGFWWVRMETVPWAVVKLQDGALSWPGLDGPTASERDPGVEWGPYLGKEPETIESLERKINEAFATATPRFVIPQSSAIDPATAAMMRAQEALAALGSRGRYSKPRTLPDGTVDLSTWEPIDN